MKYFLLLGGFCGFLTVFLCGIVAGNDLGSVLRNASIGCVAGAFLMRGFRSLLAQQVRQLAQQQSELKASPAAPSR